MTANATPNGKQDTMFNTYFPRNRPFVPSAPAKFYPASGKQVDFICKLLDSKTHDLDAEAITELMADRELSKKAASTLIDILVKAPWADRKPAAPKAPAAPAAPAVTEGFYVQGKDVAKVQKAVHGSGNLYAKLMEQDTGRFNYVQGLIGRLGREGWARLTLEQAKELGHLYGRCMICGRTLTDDDSIAAGIGPICAGRL